VDQDGNVLDILVQSRHNKKAAKDFFASCAYGLHYVPRTTPSGAREYRTILQNRFQAWNEVTGVKLVS